MKKIITLLSAVAVLSIGMFSCSDAKSEATCTYFVSGDSITYTDTLDMKYDSIIGNYIVASQYAAYTYKESARSNQGQTRYAIEDCNELAAQTFSTKSPTSLDLNLVKEELYNTNLQYFNDLGINNPDNIDLHAFTVYVTLWNYSYNYKLLDAKIEVR